MTSPDPFRSGGLHSAPAASGGHEQDRQLRAPDPGVRFLPDFHPRGLAPLRQRRPRENGPPAEDRSELAEVRTAAFKGGFKQCHLLSSGHLSFDCRFRTDPAESTCRLQRPLAQNGWGLNFSVDSLSIGQGSDIVSYYTVFRCREISEPVRI